MLAESLIFIGPLNTTERHKVWVMLTGMRFVFGFFDTRNSALHHMTSN